MKSVPIFAPVISNERFPLQSSLLQIFYRERLFFPSEAMQAKYGHVNVNFNQTNSDFNYFSRNLSDKIKMKSNEFHSRAKHF